MKRLDVVRFILGDAWQTAPHLLTATAFAPSNIALCKYWGKRDAELNLPVTSSLSVSLADKGAKVTLKVHALSHDTICLNGNELAYDSAFSQRLVAYLNLFRPENLYFAIDITSTVPIAAGLASSACGFASIILALNQLFGWNLSLQQLSILARLGSGSACRSLWQGWVEWHEGRRADGMDSHGEPLSDSWPELRVGLLILEEQEKTLSSRQAMERTVATSPLYAAWPKTVSQDMADIKQAIQAKNFTALGKVAEANALAMHATMQSARPAILYATPLTISSMKTVWQLRHAGLDLYFTQDAGPNLKLLFLEHDQHKVLAHFPHLAVIKPF